MAIQHVNDPSSGKSDTGTPKGDASGEGNAYLGPWQTKEAAEEGVKNLTSKMDAQGNELGTLRKQVDYFMQQQQGGQGQQPQPMDEPAEPGPDYAAEMQAVQKEMAALDSDEPGYQKAMGKLVLRSNQITAEQVKQDTLAVATQEFAKVLDERDTAEVHKNFYQNNQDFNSPEMQMRIQERIENDQTGMSDPLVAYREIQRDDAAAEAAALKEENEEIKRLLDLKEGTEATGKVVTKGQSPQQKTKAPKATGAALDQGMQAALDALR